MVLRIFRQFFFIPIVVTCLVLFGCSDSMGSSNVQTSGTQPDPPNEIEAVDGSIVSVSDFNGVPTAMWFWSPN